MENVMVVHSADISALISECARIKNHLRNQNGYAPVQWVLGYLPVDNASLIDGDPEEQLRVHQAVADAEDGAQDVFQRQLLMRQFAKEAYIKTDASQRIRKAMLRRSVPLRGPYAVGDLVSFLRRGRWYGPDRVLGHVTMSLWIIHSGICILVSETTVRPASTQEVLKKQALELRPSRQRRRSIYVQPSEDDKSPFSEDVLVAGDLRGGQAPFVDARPTEDAGGEDVQEVERDLAGDFGGGKAGAGMELHYAKETEEIQAELVETMKKEWSNWEKYSDGKWITKAELDAMKEEGPAIKVIIRRWAHTNKSEPNQPRKLKSRLVVRGDLEDSSTMRCDPPTASQTAMGLVFTLSASRQTDLYGGDIFAAFLQGSSWIAFWFWLRPRRGFQVWTLRRRCSTWSAALPMGPRTHQEDGSRIWNEPGLHAAALRTGSLRPSPS